MFDLARNISGKYYEENGRSTNSEVFYWLKKKNKDKKRKQEKKEKKYGLLYTELCQLLFQ